jgi:hypothetical protein
MWCKKKAKLQQKKAEQKLSVFIKTIFFVSLTCNVNLIRIFFWRPKKTLFICFLVFLAELEDSPWDGGIFDLDLDWHSFSHSARSLAASLYLFEAAREAKFLGRRLFLENMVTHFLHKQS